MNNQPQEVLLNIEDVPKTIKKNVLRAFCIKTDLSLNLEDNTLYYLEPHSNSHCYVSRFPSARTSHMGVYKADRFKVIREEVVEVDNPAYQKALAQLEAIANEQTNEIDDSPAIDESLAILAESTLVNEDDTVTTTTPTISGTLNEKAEITVSEPSHEQKEPSTNSDAIAEENAVEEEPAPIKTVKELPFAQHYNVQGDDEVPTITDVHLNLEHGVLYEATVIYRRPTYALFMEVGAKLYITRPQTSYEYYHDHMCHVYGDAQLKEGKGTLPLYYFSDFKKIGNVEDIKNKNDNKIEGNVEVNINGNTNEELNIEIKDNNNTQLEVENDVVNNNNTDLEVKLEIEKVVEVEGIREEQVTEEVAQLAVINTYEIDSAIVEPVEAVIAVDEVATVTQGPVISNEPTQEDETKLSSGEMNLFDMPVEKLQGKKRKTVKPKIQENQLDLFGDVFF